MNQNKIGTLVPNYIKKFSCLGSACEDDCCYGWTITIDKKIFKKYKKITDEELENKIEKSIKRNRNKPDDLQYAYIELNEEGICPFFEEDKLCGIHKKMGETYLSHTCRTYPRVNNGVNNSIEKSLVLSCPEVAKLVLFNPEPMEFDETEEDFQNIWLSNTINTNNIEDKNKINKYFWDLRIFTITLLQNRNYKFNERMMILGLFYNKVENYIQNNNIDLIPQLIIEYNKLINTNQFDDIFLDFSDKNLIMQLKFATELIELKNNYGITNGKYLENIAKFCEGIELNYEVNINRVIDNYKFAYENYYNPYMEKNYHIFENYFVNYVFRTLFPCSSELKNIFESYINLVIHYVILKIFLVGISAYEKGLNEKNIVDLVYSFDREIEHNRDYLIKIIKILSDNNYNTLSHMIILLKDFK